MLRQFIQWLIKWLTKTSAQPLVRSFLFLRTGIGILGVALPLVLICGKMLLEGHLGILDTMSAYYQSVMRDVFVGSLWAIGIFLICYRYDNLDDFASTIAGVSAIVVALFPNPPMHQLAAACFFVILALMAIFLFRRTDQEKLKRRKQQRNTVYLICGIAIVLCLVLIVVVNFLPGNSWLQPLHPILVLEALASFAFGFAWFVKGGTFILKDN
jgi:MFS superfamily sulfate permease-like transporter